MASIRRRPTSYQVVYRDPTRRQRVETFFTHADAKRRKAEIETDLHRGVWADPDAGKAKFEEVWFAYLDAKQVELRPSTFRLYESIGSTYVAGTFGERTIGDIRPADVRAWIAGLASEGHSRSLIGTARLVMHQVCALALTDGLIPSNPVIGTKLPAPVRSEKRVLLPEEVEAIADAIDPRYRALVLVGGYCGLRLGEALGLRWKRVDVLARRLSVVEQLDRDGELADVKTRASRRTVPIPGFVADELAALAPGEPDAFVFTTATGAPVSDGNFRRRVWKPALAKAGVRPAVFHDLRHHCASYAISLDAHPKAIADLLGHSSVRVTLDVYGDLFPSLATDLADRMDAAHRERNVTALRRSS